MAANVRLPVEDWMFNTENDGGAISFLAFFLFNGVQGWYKHDSHGSRSVCPNQASQ